MVRRSNIQERFYSQNIEIIKAAQSNKGTRLSMIENSHSAERENFRMYSRTQLIQAFLKGKMISSSYNKVFGEYRFVLKYSFKTSVDYERPIHLIVATHKSNLLDWTIITVMDPASRKFKWDDTYENQICFCDRNSTLNYVYN